MSTSKFKGYLKLELYKSFGARGLKRTQTIKIVEHVLKSKTKVNSNMKDVSKYKFEGHSQI